MNNKKISYIKIKKKEGNYFLKLLKAKFKDISILNKKYKIELDTDYILFPLIENSQEIKYLIDKITNKIDFKIISKQGILNPQFKPKTLYEFLKNEIPDEFIKYIPNSYDLLGKIAIVEFEKFKIFDKEDIFIIKKKIADGIIKLNKNVDTVFEKKGEIKGSHRIRELEFLSGMKNSITLYKENGCVFKLDVTKTFFTPRLIYERKRISESIINDHELIIDLFAGVGPFSIQIAKKNKVTIYAFDINTIAYNYLKENIKRNQLKGKIYPYNIDIKDLLDPQSDLRRELSNNADRIIMNLPGSAIDFIEIPCILMKNTGGILHIYQFCEKPNPIEKALDNLTKNLERFNWRVKKLLSSKVVKSYSPKSDMIVLDAVIEWMNHL